MPLALAQLAAVLALAGPAAPTPLRPPETRRADVVDDYLDMLRFHRFTIGWAWKSDYGSSETREGFETLVRYSPLHNLRPGTRHPATLVLTADHDDRVVPAHSHEFTAALQAAQGGAAPVLARIETRAGHGAGQPTAKLIAERTDVLAFLVRVLEMALPPGFGERSGTVPASRAQ